MRDTLLHNADLLPSIALVGRVNVGKSTLFNRITDSHQAIVSKEPGTTRTRNIGIGRWRDVVFRLIDTGGVTYDNANELKKELYTQLQLALEEADLIALLVDLKEGPTVEERRLALEIKKKGLPILLVGNKADNDMLAAKVYEKHWRLLRLGTPLPVSATTGRGVGDMIDALLQHPRFAKTSEKSSYVIPKNTVRVAIIGKPNVGKSSFFNALIGHDSAMVSAQPHTTRESHDTLLEWQGHPMLFIDTAGVRRKALVEHGIERMGVTQSLQAIARADIVLFVLDATEPVSHQDKALAGMIERHQKPLIIVANKWDMIQKIPTISPHYKIFAHAAKHQDMAEQYRAYLTHHFKFVSFAPILFVSAKTKKYVKDIFPLITEMNRARAVKIDPVELEQTFREIVRTRTPIKGKGVRHPKLYSIKQLSVAPPVFELAVKRNTNLHVSYLRFLERKLRERFGFAGIPMVFYIKKVSL